jgi:hypothetical protein
MASAVIPPGGVARVSRARFAPGRLAEVQRMLRDNLREMTVDARRDAEAVGVSAPTILNHPVVWQI